MKAMFINTEVMFADMNSIFDNIEPMLVNMEAMLTHIEAVQVVFRPNVTDLTSVCIGLSITG